MKKATNNTSASPIGGSPSGRKSKEADSTKEKKAPRAAIKTPVKATKASAKTVAKPKETAKPASKATKKTETKAEALSGHALPEEKQKIIEKFAQKNGDTGSPEVQVALLTHKIDRLIEHLDENKKDNHSRRGLLKVVAKRRRILNYLVKIDKDRYQHLIGELGLKK